MAASNGATAAASKSFAAPFADVVPLILEEWPDVAQTDLDGTDGEYDKVVTVVAKKTEHTKTLVKRQLEELDKMASEASHEGRLKAALHRLEGKTHEIGEYVKTQMVPNAEQKVRDHLLISMLTTAAFGFLLGFIFRGFGRR
jgi:ElaB/YqjD/DUF883 family membrane-anchored ribosome-binding protein